jgi:adenine-specific DNA-methyltransferase
MTFEPTEIEEIRIPSLRKLDVDFKEIDQLIRNRKVEQVLDIIDKKLLIKKHGFTSKEVIMLRGIWKKLSTRRRERKN